MTLTKTSKRLTTSAVAVLLLAWQVAIPLKAGASADYTQPQEIVPAACASTTDSADSTPSAAVPDDCVAATEPAATSTETPAAKTEDTAAPREQGLYGDNKQNFDWIHKPAKGSITIVKDAQPDDEQNFAFSIYKKYTYWGDHFTLDDDGNNDDYYKNSKTFEQLHAGTYVITEKEALGWKLSDISCSEDADVVVSTDYRKATIYLKAGENVTCTFVNQKKGKIKVYKHTEPAGSHTKFIIKASTTNGDIYGDATRWIADGQYEYFVVSQGTYDITEVLPEGWVQVNNTCEDITVAADNLYQTCHITNAREATLKIKKETNPESAQDFSFSSEQLGSFTLDDDNDPTLANYKQFRGLAPGYYTITEEDFEGWDLKDIECWGTRYFHTDLKDSKLSIKLTPGDDVTCKFTNVERNAISGYKFEDLNGNGEWDDDEPTLSGWTIVLTRNCDDEDTDCDPEVETKVTNEDGFYRFGDREPGDYTVCEEGRDNWKQTYPDDDCYQVNLEGPGEEEDGVNFGNFELGKVSGITFNDRNSNGVRDEGEPLLKDWTITLSKIEEENENDDEGQAVELLSLFSSSDPAQTAQTNTQGAYKFTGLQLGDYQVCVTPKANWTRTYPANSNCHTFTIKTSGQKVTADFGHKTVPQVLGAATPTSKPKQLANTGSAATKNLLVGLTVLSVLAAAHFMTARRKDYVQ